MKGAIFVVSTALLIALASGQGDENWKGRALRLVLNDDFNGPLNLNEWEHEVTLGGGGNWEFQAYTPLPETSFTRDGALFLKPMPTADKYGENFLTTGVWDMTQYYGKCTDSRFYGCTREGRYGYLNPVLSARVKTKKMIKYGKVEVKAKMPLGDWLWPALWLLSGPAGTGPYGVWPRSGEIDIMESRGNRNYGNLGVEYLGTTLHWGVDGINKWEMTTAHKKLKSGNVADGYHTYTMYWDETEMVFYVDGELIVRYPTPQQGFFRWGNLPGPNIWASANNAPFNNPFFLTMNVAVGGTNGFFPDNVPNASGQKPWTNQDANGPEKFWKGRGQWLPTWQGDNVAMQVDYVRLWQLE